jgi:hypothetical protein
MAEPLLNLDFRHFSSSAWPLDEWAVEFRGDPVQNGSAKKRAASLRRLAQSFASQRKNGETPAQELPPSKGENYCLFFGQRLWLWVVLRCRTVISAWIPLGDWCRKELTAFRVSSVWNKA